MSNNVSIEYANGIVKTLEKNLLTREKIVRLTDADSVETAVKILLECNYGRDGFTGDIDKLLFEEENKVTDIFKELMPSGYALETFVYASDYHNAKACYKSKIVGKPNPSALRPSGLFDVQSAFETENYRTLPTRMCEAIAYLDELNQKGQITGATIDNVFDKAYYKNVFDDLAKAKKSVVNEYFVLQVDSLNIKNFARCKKIGLDFSEYRKCFIDGGKTDLKKLETIYSLSLAECKEKMKFGDYAEDFSVLSGDYSAYETFADNRLIKLFKNQKSDMFSPSPVLGYYLGKLCELKVVRTVLTCKANKLDRNEIRKRIRETYA